MEENKLYSTLIFAYRLTPFGHGTYILMIGGNLTKVIRLNIEVNKLN